MGEVTLAEYLAYAKATPVGTLHYQAAVAETNDDYHHVVQRALKIAIAEIVANRRHKQGHSEDALNVELVSLMRFAGLSAYHDVKYGGHTDISVRLGDDYLWIAEAKKWEGSAWAFSGLKQIGRYMSGLPGQDKATIILYMFKENATSFLTTWRNRISKVSSLIIDATIVANMRFTSTHHHLGAGSVVTIEHIAVPLFWDGDSSKV